MRGGAWARRSSTRACRRRATPAFTAWSSRQRFPACHCTSSTASRRANASTPLFPSAGSSAGSEASMSPEPRLALVGFRSDESSSYLRGAAEAPPLIRQAVFHESANPWCESGVEVGRSRFHDAGDFGEAPGKDTRATIEAVTAALLDEGYRPIALGGDHAI